MRSGKEALRLVAVLGPGFILAGCVTPSSLPPLADPIRPPTPAPSSSVSPLRIPAAEVAAPPPGTADKEIPLVPVPPPPLSKAPPSAAVPPPAPPPTPPPVTTTPPAATDPLRRLYQQAAERYASLDSYIVRLTRREQVNGKSHPEEVLLFKFRKKPWSVYFKWLGEEGKGREVVYVRGQHENKIHTLLAAGDVPLMPAGKRMALAVDSVLVRSASRHPITDAGVGACIDWLGNVLDAQERGDKRLVTVAYLGPRERPEFTQPVEAIEYTLAAGAEPELPRGGRRLVCFDRDHHLPVLIVTRDERGQEVEYYRYDRFQLGVRLDNDDFDPDKLWKPAPRPVAPAGERGSRP